MKRAGIVGVILMAATGCETAGSLSSNESGGYAPAEVRAGAVGRYVASDAELVAPAARISSEPAAPLAAPAASPATREITRRLVVYSASLRLVVASTADARASVQRIASEASGFLQESDARSITIRVPAERFEATVSAIEKLGEVVDRAVKASDVSEQMLDLDIRLENARATRDRLQAHLARSEKMEDTIRLEAELSRVTTEIELIEGKKRLLASQIAMSTIRVELNASRPQSTRGEAMASPFPWVAQLGDGLVAGAGEAMPRQPRFLAGGPKFDPPAGFVRYFSSKDLVEAMDAEGVRIKVQRQPNFDRAPATFWHKLARKVLVGERALALTSDGGLAEGKNWSGFGGTREVGRETYRYLLVMMATNDDVYCFEAWGPARSWENDEKPGSILKSATSMRP